MVDKFEPEIFLEIAKSMRNLRNLDYYGRLRTGISRAYYAAFLKSFIKLQSLGESFPDESRIHAEVRFKLQKRKKSNIASKLDALFRMRVKADYKLQANIDTSLYQSSITLSENIINLVDSSFS